MERAKEKVVEEGRLALEAGHTGHCRSLAVEWTTEVTGY